MTSVTLSPRGREIAVALIGRAEGDEHCPYLDVAGIPTIGRGCRFLISGAPVTMSTPPLTTAQDDELFDHALGRVVANLMRLVSIDLDDEEAGALLSLAWNVGTSALATSTLLRLLNRHAIVGAADQFLRWDHAGGRLVPGLVTRRHLERAVFLGDVAALQLPHPIAPTCAAPIPYPEWMTCAAQAPLTAAELAAAARATANEQACGGATSA